MQRKQNRKTISIISTDFCFHPCILSTTESRLCKIGGYYFIVHNNVVCIQYTELKIFVTFLKKGKKQSCTWHIPTSWSSGIMALVPKLQTCINNENLLRAIYHKVVEMLSSLPQSSNSGWWIEHYFCTIDPIHHPVLRVVAPITNVDRKTTKLCLQRKIKILL